MASKKKLYLIDGSSYIFRAFFGIRHNLSNSKGQPTNALYGFTTMLMKVVREEQPDYLAVVFDSKEKTFRHEMYADYKANRDVPPEDLAVQFPYFEPLVDAFNIKSLRKPGFEADDIIGTLAREGEKAGMDVTIVSGDKDMMQLITDKIHMLDTMKEKRFGIDDVKEKFGVEPDRVIEVMGLMGDSSDHIPGVKGVGPKTATDLIQKYGSIQGLYEHLDEIDKAKLKEKLETDKDNALLSRELVTIKLDTPIDCKIEDLEARDPDNQKLRELFTDLEFKTLLAALPEGEGGDGATAETGSAIKRDYDTILDDKALDDLIKKLKKAKAFALDLETTSKRPVKAKMVGISFSWAEGEACYIPVAHRYLGVPEQLGKQHVLDKLKPLLEDPKLEKYGHNIKYDLIVLHNEGVQLRGIVFDSMLASYVLDPSRRSHSLDDLALEMFQHTTIKYSDVAGSASKQVGFDEVEIERASEYAAEDSDITYRLTRHFEKQLKGEDLELYETIELPLLEVLAEMELAGVLLDTEHLKKLSKKLEKDLKKIEDEIYALAGEPFNINSPKQLSTILFEKLKLRTVKKTKSGYSTDVSVLEELAAEHDLPDKILNYRQFAKMKSTYVDALQGEVFKETGRIHTSYNQTVAATGRLSSSDPNLQNIPIRSEVGREIRKAFLADKGCWLLSADYSQIELRLLAHLSGDPALIRAFKNNEDIHSRTAAEIFGQPIDQVDPEGRRMAKAVNFGIVYGLSAYGLSRQLKITPKDAKTFIDQYFDLYKNVKTFMDETIEMARKNGYTKTMMNRRRYMPDINSKNRQVREAAERTAINSPVQGSAADFIKMAMLNIHDKMLKEKLASRMILQVHDELIFECPESEKKAMEPLVRKAMEGVAKLKVPLTVNMDWGENWSDAH
ncbi:DNA polymerase I [Nitrospina sp. 32_T5]|uniref:DNA polymerase I n=1 Tax=unclassified Nitrospina TaxID=2638683 RepID=UPI003F9DA24C